MGMSSCTHLRPLHTRVSSPAPLPPMAHKCVPSVLPVFAPPVCTDTPSPYTHTCISVLAPLCVHKQSLLTSVHSPQFFSAQSLHTCVHSPPQSLCALVHSRPIFAHARACALSPRTMSVLRSLHTRVHFCALYFCTPTHIYTPSPYTLVLTSVLAHQCMCTPTPCTCTCPAPPPLTCTHSICMATCAPTRVCHFGGEGGR